MASEERSSRIIVDPSGKWSLTLMMVRGEIEPTEDGQLAYRQFLDESTRSRRMVLGGPSEGTTWYRDADGEWRAKMVTFFLQAPRR